jgi:hypothetical protein
MSSRTYTLKAMNPLWILRFAAFCCVRFGNGSDLGHDDCDHVAAGRPTGRNEARG